jgi:hypothetical protein
MKIVRPSVSLPVYNSQLPRKIIQFELCLYLLHRSIDPLMLGHIWNLNSLIKIFIFSCNCIKISPGRETRSQDLICLEL